MKGSVTWGDTFLIIALAVFTAASLFGVGHFSSPGSTVLIELKDLVVYKGNLGEDRKVTIRGGHGDVRIQIREGKVAVVYAECPNKVCVRTGWRSLAGDVIVCVPNRVLVRILGVETKEIRGITG